MTLLKSKVPLFLAGFLLGGLLMYILFTVFSTPSTISEEPSWRTSAGPRVGLPVPRLPLPDGSSADVDVKNTNWTLRKLDSSEVQFSEFAGKIVVLNLWGTWCQPCVWEMPYLQDLHDSFKGQPIAFFAVSDEPLATLRVFAAKERLTDHGYL
jgi:thiol-disulfide isomerase/thioredoxin